MIDIYKVQFLNENSISFSRTVLIVLDLKYRLTYIKLFLEFYLRLKLTMGIFEEFSSVIGLSVLYRCRKSMREQKS